MKYFQTDYGLNIVNEKKNNTGALHFGYIQTKNGPENYR
ncbi:hypothetical protein SLEP1_g17546 [Rubroshorea leprosula]|uniref:Uncharacterized protein n=1 Tax=Rubroshorea leprosula TaxID=152421 RepID=A0AAV5J0G3_9ROSI|nr:hypothetical protein SLEP1_g17546 [Rubroshorea leprosula]